MDRKPYGSLVLSRKQYLQQLLIKPVWEGIELKNKFCHPTHSLFVFFLS